MPETRSSRKRSQEERKDPVRVIRARYSAEEHSDCDQPMLTLLPYLNADEMLQKIWDGTKIGDTVEVRVDTSVLPSYADETTPVGFFMIMHLTHREVEFGEVAFSIDKVTSPEGRELVYQFPEDLAEPKSRDSIDLVTLAASEGWKYASK